MSASEIRLCVIVPHYNHAAEFVRFLPKLASIALPILVVDDGSDQHNAAALADALKAYPAINCIRHATNRGKGAAVISAFYWARNQGYTHVLQIDADGQHEVGDIETFLRCAERHPQAIISGNPVFDHSVPKARLYGRKVTDFWVMLETWSLLIKDSLCGFRIYPLNAVEDLLDRCYLGPHMEFDTEMLVKAVWHDIPLQYIDTQVVYPANSVSHFRYGRDNCRLIILHTRLMLGMIWRSPVLATRRLRALAGRS